MITDTGWLIVVLAVAFGWVLGYFQRVRKQNVGKTLSKDYFVGLKYLINEQPDKAVDIFIKLLHIDTDTIEMHLALGSLFRRRGEVDRAIHIHQNLISRSTLEEEYRIQALAELAEDYLKAGVLDRAESLFLELIELGREDLHCLKNLLNIYQQEKNWSRAIEIARKLNRDFGESMQGVIAHYYCEMAERSMARRAAEEAEYLLQRAQATDKRCARVHLIRAKWAMNASDYRTAIRHYEYIRELGSDYISEVLEPMIQCYQEIGDETGLLQFFKTCLTQYAKSPLIQLLVNRLPLGMAQDHSEVVQLFLSYLNERPTLQAIHRLVDVYDQHCQTTDKSKWTQLNQLLQSVVHERPQYQCARCGFLGGMLYWSCPSCHQWNSVKFIHYEMEISKSNVVKSAKELGALVR